MWPNFSRACRRKVDAVLRSGILTAYRANLSWGSIGPRKDSQAWRLEREIEKKFKVRHAVVVNSGTSALHTGLAAVGVQGKEVVTSPYTFSGTVAAILHAGGTPRFCDIDPHTLCLDPKAVKRVVTKRTAAILPVHIFGYMADLRGLREFGVPIVEDACQAVGASRGGTHAGTGELAGAFSFNGSKAIPTGEGGALVTNDDAIAEKARRFINHGENFGAKEVGVNYRMHELVACLARHGLKSLEERNERRRELVDTFAKSLKDELVRRPRGNKHWDLFWPNLYDSHVYYVYGFKFYGDRSRFIARCAKRGLPIQAGYTTPLHRLPALKKYQTTPLPVTERLHDKELCLLTTLTPDRPLSYARWCAKVIRESLA